MGSTGLKVTGRCVNVYDVGVETGTGSWLTPIDTNLQSGAEVEFS